MHRATRWGRRLCLAALLSFVLVALTDTIWGREVTLLMRLHDATERAEARAIYDPRDDVAEIYGRVEPKGHLRVIVFDDTRLITPAEDPSRRLLFVDRPAGASVLPARTLWGRAGYLMFGLAALGIVLLWRGRSRASA